MAAHNLHAVPASLEEDEQTSFLLGAPQSQKETLKKTTEYLGLDRKALDKDGDGVLGFLYGNIQVRDFPRVAWLSCTLACIIGGFWLLDSLKDALLERTVGMARQPGAKLLSTAVTLFLVINYNKLVDTVRRATLFYILGGAYTFLLLLMGAYIRRGDRGVGGDWGWDAVGLGSYVVVESYGSLTVALFWAFVNAAGDLEEAKASYGIIIAGAQIGAIAGSTLATTAAGGLGLGRLFQIAALSPALTAIMVWGYVRLFGDHVPREREGGNAGPLEGLRLIVRYRYVLLILGVSCLYEVALTVLDYQMKMLGVAHFSPTGGQGGGGGSTDGDTEQFAALMGFFGQITNCLSLLLSLLGTSFIIRRAGLPLTLTVFPALLVVAIVVSYFHPNLWVLFVAVSVLKGLSYALNEPCKEILYMVTSDSIKFKAKAWIDVFGSRCAKGAGALITGGTTGRVEILASYGSFAIFLLSLGLLGITLVIGVQFQRLVETGEIVGASAEPLPPVDNDFIDMDEGIALIPRLSQPELISVSYDGTPINSPTKTTRKVSR